MQEVNLEKNDKKRQTLFNKLFLIGIFFLPTAFSLSAIVLLICVFNGALRTKGYFQDKFNICFFSASIILLISATVHTNFNDHLSNFPLNHSLSWLGLANWIPFFLCFWGFQPYLNSNLKRRKTGLIFFAGSLPVLITGIGQSFFNWYGPMETLNGLIIWYQRPLDNITGMTGLFNNPNYTGLWLNLIFPFCLAELIHFRKYKLTSIFTYLFSFLFAFCTVLTNSRAAWISILMGSALMFGKKGLKFILYLLMSIFFVLSATIFPILGNNTLFFLRSIIPTSIWMEFTDLQISRLDIWNSALKTIINNPIFGTGGGSFPEIYKYETGLWKGHAHNLPLELFVSYGIPAGILILLPITYLFLVTTKVIFFKRPIQISIFDKAWLTSILLLLFSQLVDVQYFDGRISIVFWILVSGARNIFDQDKDNLSSSF